MTKGNIEDIYPLSPMQQGILFHSLYAPESGVYFQQLHCLLYGKLDAPLFKQAWQHVVKRHTILRTAFLWQRQGEPLQAVRHHVEIPLEQQDWRRLTAGEQSEQLQAYLAADRMRGFKLTQAPLLRLALIQVDEDTYHFVLSHHHLLLDGWSLAQVLYEAFAWYEALCKGTDFLLEQSRPYGDYIAWLQGQDLAWAETFWRQALKHFATPTPLQIDRSARTVSTGKGDYETRTLQLPTAITTGLRSLARQWQLTLNTLVQGAWALLLGRYSGKEDVVFGMTVAGRPADLAGVETMVGLFINTLPIRVQVSPEARLLAWFSRLQDQLVELRQYEYSPLVQVQRWSEVPVGLPLFESIVVFENYPTALAQEKGERLRIAHMQAIEQPNYPLTVLAGIGMSGELTLRISYNTTRFDSATIARMLNHLSTLLSAMLTATPDRRIVDLPMLTEAERQRLLVDVNTSQAEYPMSACVHHLFAAQVRQTPDAVAVVFEDQQLTYQELNSRANQVAHYLRSQQVGPETLVGICMERSIELMVGLLGILKAGGAYVPLDPSYPANRLTYMLTDAQIPVVLTQEQLRERLLELPEQEVQVISLDVDRAEIAKQPVSEPPVHVHEQDLAYVIYTSGSTGKPKGVAVAHQSIVNFLLSMSQQPGLQRRDILLAVTTLAFDIAGLELFLPLIVGARVVLLPREITTDGMRLAESLETYDATVMQATPATWRLLVEAEWQGRPGLKILCGGEAFHRDLANRLLKDAMSVWNMYGPTETTIWSMIQRLSIDEGPVFIGHPIANTQIYLLDQHFRPVPIGVPGELYIGGDGLARGYLRRADLTAERFVPDPFSTTPGVRLYRTGDRARMVTHISATDRPLQEDEPLEVEYLGRNDYQVKVRGYRIELGEIEAALSHHPAVRETVVLLREDLAPDEHTGEGRHHPAHQHLVAYVMPQPDQVPTPMELRRHLQAALPDYMLPAAFVFLDTWPLTPNRKLDRQALPAPDWGGVATREAYLAPRTPIEDLLVGIWAEVLGIISQRISVDANFFELGGHSFLAMRLAAHIRTMLQVEVPLRQIFETPTVAGLAKYLEGARLAAQCPHMPPLLPVSRFSAATEGETTISVMPLSFAQERLWFLHQWEPHNSAYNVHLALRLRGPLDRRALEQSLNEIVRRHEVLRTSFIVPARGEGRPLQHILPGFVLPLPLRDLTALPRSEQEAELHRLATQEVQQPFNLAHGPLIRASLLLLDRPEEVFTPSSTSHSLKKPDSSDEHVLLLTMHHIICDGWSIGIMMQELAALYSAYTDARPSPLSDLPVQYADYALWQREWLLGRSWEMSIEGVDQLSGLTAEGDAGTVLSQQLDYWRKQLADLPTLDLPLDYPRPAVQTFAGAHYTFTLSQSLTEELKRLSQQERTTLFMTLLAAFQVLLSRYSRQQDIVVGTPIANRTQIQVEDLIGLFVNTLILRTDLSGNPSFRELLRRVRHVALGAYAHQDVPFEYLVDHLTERATSRDLSRNPLFQVLFTLQYAPLLPQDLAGVALSPLSVERGTAQFDLSLALTEYPQELKGVLEYNTDLFSQASIARLVHCFQTLLAAIVQLPDQPIADLPLLTMDQQEHLLHHCNATERPYPLDQCLHRLIEARVERTPEAIALVFEEQALSYRELNRRANQLAHALRARGVGPEVCVAICLPRSLDLVIALLAVLKTGGAYIPLDPSYPQERLAFILAQARPPVILTQAALPAPLSPGGAQVLCLQAEWPALAQQPTNNLPVAPGPAMTDTLAYVIYTSGSTGQPKGVMNTHQGIVNRLLWMQETYPLQPADRVLQKTPTSFDVSVWEFFWPLLVGARLVVARPEGHRDSSYLLQLINEQQITTLHFVPSMLRVFLEEPAVETCQSMRQVFCSGEALPFELQQRFFQHSGAALHNLYGPTEAAIDVTYWNCEPAGGLQVVPIGRPIANTRIFLLDEHLQPVPVGVVGELYIGGVGVARGYLKQPDLTAERFVPDPFATIASARLYRTGDLARYLPINERSTGLFLQGEHDMLQEPTVVIEYVGRRDQQIKLRGYRIELGEIEAALRRHDQVEEALVLLQQESAEGSQLVVYVVVSQQSGLTGKLLRAFLKQWLPDYMIPAAFVFLEALPLLPNGKLDRRALPSPEQIAEAPSSAAIVEAVRTPTEEILAEIWARVLRISGPVGRHENFFDLGGHSLLATQVISRMHQTFQVDLPLRALFEEPTVAALAQRLETARLTISESPRPPIRPLPRAGELPLSFTQQRLWFLDRWERGSPLYNIPIVLQLTGHVDLIALERSLHTIVSRHEILRTTFPMAQGRPLQRIEPAPTLALTMIDLHSLPTSEQKAELERLIHEEAIQPFDLAQEPLMRVTLVHLGRQHGALTQTVPQTIEASPADNSEHFLLLTFHHIIIDGWSIGLLYQELTALYTAYVTGQESSLPALPIQYADFAAWQREWLSGKALERQLAYWRRQLQGMPAMLDLPLDHPRPAVQTFHGAHYVFALPQALINGLKQLSRHEGVTLFMTLLAAFQVLLSCYSEQEDIVVGTDVANRTHIETENLIGFFVNQLVLRTDLSGHPSFQELLARVRMVTLEAYAHQDLPFDQVVEALQPARDLSRNPLFQVLFTLQNTPLSPLQLAGLTLRPLEVENHTAKFDLALALTEHEHGLKGIFEYNSDLFAAETIARMAGHYHTLLASVLASPTQPIATIALLPAHEQRQLLTIWNASHQDSPQPSCLLQRFARQVALRPDAIALSDQEGQFTYQDLAQRVEHLARHLRANGVGTETLVAVLAPRTSSLLIALLSILQAAGTYLPLDPQHPPARLRQILQQGRPLLLLTCASTQSLVEQTLDELPASARPPVLLLEELSQRPAPREPLARRLHERQLAYVLFTSGSTGVPKGAMIEQRGMLNHLLAKISDLAICASDTVAQTASQSFDISLWQLLAAVLVGGRVHVVADSVAHDPLALLREVQQQAISLLETVPSLLQALLLALEQPGRKPAALPALRWLIPTGEALPPQLCRRWLALYPHIPLLNAYGPTECSDDVTHQPIDQPPAAELLRVPIGRPLANTRLYVLSRAGMPQPIGVPGELYVGGMGVGRGYLGDPARTATCFVPDPFSGEVAARLYRTGDRVRYLADGSLEFLGRVDAQVKLRGYRIELSEIETMLRRHPAVQQALVVLREDSPASAQLVAYLVADHEPISSDSELRAYLKQWLPEYMVPSAFVLLDTLPLTPNGKVDRRALPPPDAFTQRAGQQDGSVAPRTPVEAVLAEIWAEALNCEQVGIHDNFFEVGGHSLLAALVIARILDVLQVELPLRTIFEAPTIAEMAALLCQDPDRQTKVERVAQLLLRISTLSDDEVEMALQQETSQER